MEDSGAGGAGGLGQGGQGWPCGEVTFSRDQRLQESCLMCTSGLEPSPGLDAGPTCWRKVVRGREEAEMGGRQDHEGLCVRLLGLR